MPLPDAALNRWLKPQHSTLVLVDLQNDWLHSEGGMGQCGYDMCASQAIMPRVREVLAAARLAGALVIFTRNWLTPWTASRAQQERRRWTPIRGGGTRGVAGSWGADWYEIQPAENDFVLNKTRYDAFLGTNLEQVLKARAIETLVFGGVATNVCVESSARAAFMRDYNVVVLGDATATTDAAAQAASLENIRNYFGVVVDSDAVSRIWRAAPRATRRRPAAG